MGKKVLRLFLETMLRAIVIILGIGIVIMGALLIKTLIKNNALTESKKTTTESTIATEAEDSDDLTFKDGDDSSDDASEAEGTDGVSSADAKILVINATGTSGVAGAWKTALESDGYSSVEVGTYEAGSLITTQVCVSGDYDGADLAAKFTSPETVAVSALNADDFDVSIDGYDIIVIVGTTDVKN